MPLERMDGPPDFIKEQRERLQQEQQSQAAAQNEDQKQSDAPAPKPEAALMLRRSISPRMFTPGDAVVVSVRFEKQSDQNPTELVLTETLPPGWSFDAVVEGPAPDEAPEKGVGGAIRFKWAKPTEFPLTLRYRTITDPESRRAQAVRGQGVYLLGDQQQATPTNAFPVRPAAPPQP